MLKDSLVRGLGFRDSFAIVAGSMIGTGIFLKTAVMTQALGSVYGVLLAWLAAGVLSLLGALTYAELGARFPLAGGGYVFMREAYGRLPSFLAGWVSFWIVFPGSIAAYAVASATFLDGAFPLGESKVWFSLSLILVFSGLNCLAITFGGLLQSALTAVKILLIVGLVGSIFFFTPSSAFQSNLILSSSTFSLGAFGFATLSALWAFDGWEAIARVGGEVKNPQRNIPLALVLGILFVFTLYALVNLAYFWALPISEINNSNSSSYPNALPVATKSVLTFLGDQGVQILSAVFLISTLGAMNGSILTSARIPYAMAKDGLFFTYFSQVSPNTKVPVRAIWLQSFIAALLTLSGTFDQLTNYVVFSAWIFYGLTGFTIFVFRKKIPTQEKNFRVPGYPFVPALFILLSVILVFTILIQSPLESVIGLIMILTGIPVYYFVYRKT